MALARIRLTHQAPDAASRHIFLNFGEDLWRLTRDDRDWVVDLAVIDRADHGFEVRVRRSRRSRATRLIGDLLAKHNLSDKVRIDTPEDP